MIRKPLVRPYSHWNTRYCNAMAPVTELSHLANPLVSVTQLETSASQLDGLPKDLEDSIRSESGRLLQAAGILLRLPQELIAQSIIILQRFWAGADGGSMLEHDPNVCGRLLFLNMSIELTIL